jgi:hypothetical protein
VLAHAHPRAEQCPVRATIAVHDPEPSRLARSSPMRCRIALAADAPRRRHRAAGASTRRRWQTGATFTHDQDRACTMAQSTRDCSTSRTAGVLKTPQLPLSQRFLLTLCRTAQWLPQHKSHGYELPIPLQLPSCHFGRRDRHPHPQLAYLPHLLDLRTKAHRLLWRLHVASMRHL